MDSANVDDSVRVEGSAKVDDSIRVEIARRFLGLPAVGQARFLAALRQQGIDFGRLPILPRRDGTVCALSSAQLRQWFLWRMDEQSTAYHIASGLRLRGTLDVDALRGAFEALLARHESLRTVFRTSADGTPEQVIGKSGELDLTRWDVSALPLQEREVEAARLAQSLASRPFDLTRGPLLRVGLIDVSAEDRILAVVMHHIVSDGWSMQILVEELVELYRAGLQGREAQLAALPIQYADYALWQRSWLEAGEQHRQLEYWKRALGAEHPVLELPRDRMRGPEESFQAAQHVFELPQELADSLQECAQSHHATLFMVLLAAFQALLHRYTGERDIRIGTTNANRTRPETQAVIGYFLNTQVLRAQFDAGLTLSALLEQVRERVVSAQEHQDLPFEQLVEALQPDRGGSQPLFQVLMDHQRRGSSALQHLPGVKVEGYSLGGQAAPFELWLNTVELRDRRIEVRWSYAAELFEASTIERLGQHYVRMLEALARHPQQRVSEVALLSEAEQRQVQCWGQGADAGAGAGADADADAGEGAGEGEGATDAASEEPIHRLIEAQAHRAPQAIALVLGDTTLSYGELNRRANRLAHRLQHRGVRAESRVGLAFERSLDMVIALLAVLKAGGAYVPLDPEYPTQRLQYVMKDSGIGLLLTQRHLADSLPRPEGLETLFVDELRAGDKLPVGDELDVNPAVPLHPDHLAYVIYTSGSTGQPKGAQLSHRNVSRLLQATQQWFGFDAQDVWTLFHSYAFDFSVWEIFGALCFGGRLVIVPREVTRAPEELLRLLIEHRVTVLNQTPSAFRQLMQVPGVYGEAGQGLVLRTVIFGGEALDPQCLRPWLAHFGDASPRLVNMYGITETTVHVTFRPIGRLDVEQAPSPVGEPIPDLTLRVLDANLNDVPIGVPGELHVAGAGLARGYLNRSALSAERFIADPYASDGARLYRTGDRVRWSGQGELEYLGRIDHQVKIRGFRIELGEIESQLLSLPPVREAVVIVQGEGEDKRLVAYVVPKHEGEELDVAALRKTLARSVPGYMLPAVIVSLNRMPLTANGKLDRKALPAPGRITDSAYEAPLGEIERALAKVWSQVLGVERVSRHDNFFNLGGDSILSLKVIARAREHSLTLTPQQIFKRQVLSALAEVLSSDVRPDASQIPRAQRGQRLALSSAQLRQWFLWRTDETSTAYHISSGLRLRGQLDVDALRGAFEALVERHESLRTVFRVAADGVPEQLIDDAGELGFVQWDVSDRPTEQRENEATHLAQSLASRPFDLTRGPLLRVGLICVAQEDHILATVMHHIVSDGWSMQVFVEELVALYRAGVQGREAKLAPLPIQYADYAMWQRSWLETDEPARQLEYWKQALGTTHPVLQLPRDHGRGTQGRFHAAQCAFELSRDLTRQLQERAQSHRATLFMALLAGFQALLHRYTGEPDIRVGTTNANRTRPETQGLVGFFVNTLVLRAQIGERQTLTELLDQARERVMGAQEHQDLPFEQLVEALQPERNASQPLFQVLMDHQRRDVAALDQLPGVTVDGYGLGEQGALFELWLNTVEQRDGRITVRLSYATELFEAETIERLGRHYVAMLEALATRPDQPIADVPLLSAPERQRLRSWESGAAEKRGEPVHRLIEAQVRRTPKATALVFESATLSYSELNSRANRLAHRLVRLGVRPEVPVGIALERSMDLVISLLAVLKAGGAYVPLDPEYPAQRLEYMMKDSGIGLLLSQSDIAANLPRIEGLNVLRLDELDLGAESDADPQVPLHAENLAYVIYTSGSTGRPKGAANRHVALHNRLAWMQEAYALTTRDAVLQKTPFSFDVSVWEFFWPLMQGARLVMAAPGAHRDPEQLVALIRRQQVTTLHFVPSMLHAFLEHEQVETCTSIERIVCSGEALSVEAERKVFARLPRAGLYNLYGPTEAAIDVTHWTCTDLHRGTVPIGQPIAGIRTLVLDERLSPALPGVAGELYLGGIGLARGYLGRAGLSSERFIADPASDVGERLYRTGDLARWNHHGELEYLGRIDHQVKIRGFRIELGEIESHLLSLPQVSEAAVIARQEGDDKRLVAYVVADEDAVAAAADESGPLVQQWESVFDTTYESGAIEPDFRGWNSSYTEQPIDRSQMQEWLQGTVERVRALKPQRVLEIGCGVGLVVKELAAACPVYVGTDVSAQAVHGLLGWAAGQPELEHLQVCQREASDFSGWREGEFDTVVLNSVVQYFPGARYLLQVLQGAARMVGTGGAVFVGDVRHLGQLKHFQTSVHLARAAGTLKVQQLRSRIAKAIQQEKELLLQPAFFEAVGRHLGLHDVDIQLKRGSADTELTRYRYDVVLRSRRRERSGGKATDWQWDGPEMLAKLGEWLSQRRGGELCVRAVPNARLSQDLAAWRVVESSADDDTVAQVRARLQARLQTSEAECVDPQRLWDLGERSGYEVRIGWTANRDDGAFDARFIAREVRPVVVRESQPVVTSLPDAEFLSTLRPLASEPLRGMFLQHLGAQLREQLTQSLPAYMVPSAITVLEAMPLNANGKLDRKALPAPEHVVGIQYEVPSGEAEQALTRVWSQVLGVERVGRHDNFFELGGDSILSLQIVARARQAGWKISPRHMFERQTIAQLSGVAEAVQTGARHDAEAFAGPVPLLPIQASFFEQDLPNRHHWNQSVLLHSRLSLDADRLKRALQAVLDHHEALRLRYTRSLDGRWSQAYADDAVAVDTAAVETVATNAAAVDTVSADAAVWIRKASHAEEVTAFCSEAQRSLHLSDGPLLRAVAIAMPDESARLLLVIHHLVVDGVSWRALLEDLQSAYRQAGEGESIVLPPKSASFQRWAQALAVDSAVALREAEYWQGVVADAKPLPCDDRHGTNRLCDQQAQSLRLSSARTRALLKDVPAAYRTQINDVLLTALARALCRWSGRNRVLIDLEGHGREGLSEEMDLSRTVGWFTCLYPVALEATGEPGAALRRVKETLRGVPRNGLGYGELRHPNVGKPRATLVNPGTGQVLFNYLGQLDNSFDGQALWMPAQESAGDSQDPESPRQHEFFVSGQVYRGELHLQVSYSGRRHKPESVRTWVRFFEEELDALIAHCTSGVRGITSSDFPLVSLTQEQLDALPVAPERIEQLYPMTPVQQGMVFHSLHESGSGTYVDQMRLDIEELNVSRFRQAWQSMFERHEMLRAGFLSASSSSLQWIPKAVPLPFVEEDWVDRPDLPQALDTRANAEFSKGFDFSTPPLMRFVLIRTGANRHHFIWTHHHALIDGWSTAQLIGEVLQEYHGRPLPPLRGRYADYADWVKRRDGAAAERYWRDRLTPLEHPTRLAADASQSEDAQDHRQHLDTLDEGFTRRLEEVARRERITVNTLVQAAWTLLLHHRTRQHAVAFGATSAGRPAEVAGIEQLLGLFINTFPVIGVVQAGQPVAEWVRALQAQNVASREHEHTALVDIQRWAGGSGQGLFDTLLVFDNYPVDETLRQGGESKVRFSGMQRRDPTHYALTVLVDHADTLTLGYHGRERFFGEGALERIALEVRHLLNQLVQRMHGVLGEIGLATPAQRDALARWEAGGASQPTVEPLHRSFEHQAERTPDDPALIADGIVFSYAQLNARANALAHRLIAQGVGRESRIGIAMTRSGELAIAILAVLKAGATYVPLDLEYPTERLRHIVQDSGVELLLTQRAASSMLASFGTALTMHVDDVDLETLPNPDVAVHAENLAYILYTSGSTGRPKGVAMRHGALVQLLQWQQDRLPGALRTLQFASVCFDVSAQELFSTWRSGAAVVMASEAERRDMHLLVASLQAHAVERIYLPFAVLQHFADAALAGGTRLPHLKQVITAGEQLRMVPSLVRWLREESQCVLINQYGPTESHVVSDFILRSVDGPHLPPIGRPIRGTRLRVLDGNLAAVPPGVTGELYIGGECLARGYLNRAGLSAERFVADPDATDGERLYRTGDLARWNAEGELDYLGRDDQQVKIRGFRIEPAEIEARLRAQPNIANAAVIATGVGAGQRLVAYVVPAGSALDVAQVRDRLAFELPDYMIPAAIVSLDALPLNANGKLNRHALPDVERAAGMAYEAPVGEIETALGAIWSQVLGIDRIGRHANFFELGGHSLLLLDVMNRARASGDPRLDLRVRDLMQNPTLANLSQAITSTTRDSRALVALNECRSGREPVFCIHPGLGTAFNYLPLARRLAHARPVQAIVCRTHIDPSFRDSSISQMAADYCRIIQARQPTGPYHLIGWSSGGMMAWLIANLLEAAGEEVQFLGLVDSYLPLESPQPAASDEWRRRLPWMIAQVAPGTNVDANAMAGFADNPFDSPDRLAEAVGHLLSGSRDALVQGYAQMSDDDLASLFMTYDNLIRLRQAYAPSRVTLSVAPHCWWAAERPRDAREELVKWIDGGVPCHHDTSETHMSIIGSERFLASVTELLDGARAVEPPMLRRSA